MEFYDICTMWRFSRKYGGTKEEYKKWYAKEIIFGLENKDKITNDFMTPARLMAELNWYKEGCPYYKIWPGVFDQFIATRLDIDTKFLRPAHKSFAIRFPKLENPLLDFETNNARYCVQSILVEHHTAEEIEDGCKIYPDISTPLDKIFPKSIFSSEKRGLSKIRIDFHCLTPSKLSYLESLPEKFKNIDCPGAFFRNIEIVPDITIEETIGQIIDIKAEGNELDTIPSSIIEACFRLIVGVYFVSTGSHKILERDILSKHLSAYQKLEENSYKRKEYEEKAIKKGKNGWNIGRDSVDRYLKLPVGVTYNEAERKAGGRHLLYSHIRGGHWHIVKYGIQKQQEKLNWYDDTVIKPELPMKPIKI